MKTNAFVPASKPHKVARKASDYWSMLFISFVFIASMSCFLFANHANQTTASNTLKETLPVTSSLIDTDQRRKS